MQKDMRKDKFTRWLRTGWVVALAVLIAGVCFIDAGVCEEIAEPVPEIQQDGMAELIQLLQQKGMISREEAERLRAQAEAEEDVMEEVPSEEETIDPETAKRLKDQLKATQAELDPSGVLKGDKETPPVSVKPQPAGMAALIQLLKQKGMITPEETAQLLQAKKPENPFPREMQMRAEQDAAKADTQKLTKDIEKTRQEINENVDQLLQRDRLTERRLEELEKKVSDEIAAKQHKTAWAERIKIGGQLRMGYQGEYMDDDNEERINEDGFVVPTDVDRKRWRYRARLDLKADLINPGERNLGKVEVGFRFASGNENDPVSTNVNEGDYFNRDDFWIDRAYLDWKWSPREQIWWGVRPQISFTGGRIANPFFHTDLVWDPDLNFEGVAVNLISDMIEGNSWRTFLTAGAFPLDEYEYRSESKWLYGYQVGFEHKPFFGLNYTLGVAYYDFKHVQGRPIVSEPTSYAELDDVIKWGEPIFSQGANTMVDLNRVHSSTFDDDIMGLAADYNELNFTAKIDLDFFFPIHIILWGDYVTNVGYDEHEIRRRYTVADSVVDPYDILESQMDQTDGYQYGITLGYPRIRNLGEWNASFFYKHLEADAVLDSFTESDFNLGGTDGEGYIIRFEYGLYKNVWLSSRFMSTNEIIYQPETIDGKKVNINSMAVDTLQVWLKAQF